jgi:DNA-binding LytR/AlgR family response regulator
MITCYVIDDELHSIEILCDLITKTPGLELIGYATNPLVGLDFITSKKKPNLTFVDIDMPSLSGIELAQLINIYTNVIFTTAFNNFALEAFDKEAFDYLLKPVIYERFLKSINKYKKYITNESTFNRKEYFYVKGEIKGKMIRINVSEITFIEGALNYVTIHLVDKTTQITYLTLGELLNQLPELQFARIHRSFIVNTEKIKIINANNITLQDKTVIPIGNAFKEGLFQALNQNLLKTKRTL